MFISLMLFVFATLNPFRNSIHETSSSALVYILIDKELVILVIVNLIQIKPICENYFASLVHLSFVRWLMNKRL